jgi:carbon-monoxide dehydrogenase large subunit
VAEVAREAYRGQRLPPGSEPGLEARHVHEPRNWAFSSPLLVDGQLHGGVAQGVGAALFEELPYDEDGHLQARTFMDYALPRAADAPEPGLAHLETPSPHTPGGVKGMSEGGTIAPPAAIANAVADALSPLGVAPDAIDAYPLTASRVFAAMAGSVR